MKTAKIALLPLLLASILALFSLYGCTATGTSTPTGTIPGQTTMAGGMSQQELQNLLSDSLANYENLNTYKFDMDMDILADVSGGAQSGEMSIFSKISGGVNMASHQMQMIADMSMSVYGSGEQSMVYDMYVLPDWTYMRMEIPGMGEQWIKMPTTDEVMESFNTDVVDQQLEPLDSPVKVELTGYDTIDGLECYVLSITPNMDELMQWVSEQQGTSEEVDWEELGMVSDAFKKLTYVCYVAKDSNYLKKMVVDMIMEFTPEQAGASPGDFDRMTMEIRMDMYLYDYNEPFSINLPDEAENAIEMSADMFT